MWEIRRVSATSGTEGQAKELVDFGWWFASRWFDDVWALNETKAVLNSAKWIEPDHLVVERLATLASAHGEVVAACIEDMIEGATKGWEIIGWRDSLRTGLSAVLASDDPAAQRAGRAAVNRLAARGYMEYSDLL